MAGFSCEHNANKGIVWEHLGSRAKKAILSDGRTRLFCKPSIGWDVLSATASSSRYRKLLFTRKTPVVHAPWLSVKAYPRWTDVCVTCLQRLDVNGCWTFNDWLSSMKHLSHCAASCLRVSLDCTSPRSTVVHPLSWSCTNFPAILRFSHVSWDFCAVALLLFFIRVGRFLLHDELNDDTSLWT